MATKVIKFRIYPESRRSYYFDVKVFPTEEKMRKYAERWGARHVDPSRFANAEAAMLPYTIKGGKTLGEIVFHKAQIGIVTVAHEATHAALRWADSARVSVDRDVRESNTDIGTQNEERFCDAIGTLVLQMMGLMHDAGLYEKWK
jgi:hypothetical protein